MSAGDPAWTLQAGRLPAPPAVVVLVGTSGSGKTSFRHRLVDSGWPADLVVSLDDLRREARAHDAARGSAARPLQAYSVSAARRALARADAMAAFGAGYVADATHLRRRDRRLHVKVARDTGLPTVAMLFPRLTIPELMLRNRMRPPEEAVPEDVLLRQDHRRSLLSLPGLLKDGFDEAWPVDQGIA